MKTHILVAGGMMLVSMAIAYAACTVSITVNCANPPLGCGQTGQATDRCGDTITKTGLCVNSVPTKPFAQWQDSDGLDSYTEYSMQCSVWAGNYYVILPSTCCGIFNPCGAILSFYVYGSPETAAYPSGNQCSVGG